MKITYLFGAGASYPDMPLVEAVPNAIDVVARQLIEYKTNLINYAYAYEPEHADNISEGVNTVISDLFSLSKIGKEHQSIDTYAKKLFIRNDTDKLKKLKKALSVFFILHKKITLRTKTKGTTVFSRV